MVAGEVLTIELTGASFGPRGHGHVMSAGEAAVTSAAVLDALVGGGFRVVSVDDDVELRRLAEIGVRAEACSVGGGGRVVPGSPVVGFGRGFTEASLLLRYVVFGDPVSR